jgi:tRNA-dihydrouridine synthase A
MKSARRFSVAPMMGYTDRYFRKLLRLLSRDSTLYTEMVTANAIVNIDRKGQSLDRWLLQDADQPVVLQLGGADPNMLADATSIVVNKYADSYQAININCGCPSKRVADAGAFGAQLMYEPDRVAAICEAVSAASGGLPVTVKHRIGVDDHDSYEQLQSFIRTISSVGVSHFIVHARKALLGRNLSPAQNRSIPPLHYPTVYALARDFPSIAFTINGGVESHEEAQVHLDNGASGVMVGRAVCKRPWYWRQLPNQGESRVSNSTTGREEQYNSDGYSEEEQRKSVLTGYLAWAQDDQDRFVDDFCCKGRSAEQLAEATRNHQRRVLRPVHNLFAAEPGGKRWRGEMEQMVNKGAGLQDTVWTAYEAVRGVVQNQKEAHFLYLKGQKGVVQGSSS